jgi:hypothetical protein
MPAAVEHSVQGKARTVTLANSPIVAPMSARQATFESLVAAELPGSVDHGQHTFGKDRSQARF